MTIKAYPNIIEHFRDFAFLYYFVFLLIQPIIYLHRAVNSYQMLEN